MHEGRLKKKSVHNAELAGLMTFLTPVLLSLSLTGRLLELSDYFIASLQTQLADLVKATNLKWSFSSRNLTS